MENTTNNKCPKCGGEMEEGMIADKIGNVAVPSESEWGTNIRKKLLNMNVLENKRIMKTNRCKNCGFLESFAK